MIYLLYIITFIIYDASTLYLQACVYPPIITGLPMGATDAHTEHGSINNQVCYDLDSELCWHNKVFWVSKEYIGIVVFCIRDHISWIRILTNLIKIFGIFGLYWGVREGRSMTTIKDEEALLQNLKNLWWIHIYINTCLSNLILKLFPW